MTSNTLAFGVFCLPELSPLALPSRSRCSLRMVFLQSSSSRVSRCIALFLMARSTRMLRTELNSCDSSLAAWLCPWPWPWPWPWDCPWLSSESVESDCEMGNLEPMVERRWVPLCFEFGRDVFGVELAVLLVLLLPADCNCWCWCWCCCRCCWQMTLGEGQPIVLVL